jgi:hypothetical protein
MAKRRAVVFHGPNHDGWHTSDIALTVTRKGIEVFGHYDEFVGLPGPTLTWEQVEAARAQVMARYRAAKGDGADA